MFALERVKAFHFMLEFSYPIRKYSKNESISKLLAALLCLQEHHTAAPPLPWFLVCIKIWKRNLCCALWWNVVGSFCCQLLFMFWQLHLTAVNWSIYTFFFFFFVKNSIKTTYNLTGFVIAFGEFVWAETSFTL